MVVDSGSDSSEGRGIKSGSETSSSSLLRLLYCCCCLRGEGDEALLFHLLPTTTLCGAAELVFALLLFTTEVVVVGKAFHRDGGFGTCLRVASLDSGLGVASLVLVHSVSSEAPPFPAESCAAAW